MILTVCVYLLYSCTFPLKHTFLKSKVVCIARKVCTSDWMIQKLIQSNLYENHVYLSLPEKIRSKIWFSLYNLFINCILLCVSSPCLTDEKLKRIMKNIQLKLYHSINDIVEIRYQFELSNHYASMPSVKSNI